MTSIEQSFALLAPPPVVLSFFTGMIQVEIPTLSGIMFSSNRTNRSRLMAAEEQSLAITAPPPVVLHHFKIIDVQNYV